MQADVFLVVGIVLGVLAIPALLNAFTESRFPRLALSITALGAGLVALAISQKPSGYQLAEIPGVFVRVVSRVLNIS